MIKVSNHVLEECRELFERLLDSDSRNDVGGAYLGDEFLAEVADLHGQIKQAIRNNVLVVRKRIYHNHEGWWIGRGAGRNFVIYTDMHAPTGYGFKSRTKAEQRANEIEEELAKEETVRRSSRRKREEQ